MLDTNVNNKFGKEGLTFDDVLLIPGNSAIVLYRSNWLVGLGGLIASRLYRCFNP